MSNIQPGDVEAVLLLIAWHMTTKDQHPITVPLPLDKQFLPEERMPTVLHPSAHPRTGSYVWCFEYHQREHSSVAIKPIDRFGLDLTRIRFLSPGDVNDELFFVGQDRSVLADNTFSVKNTGFEAPRAT